MHGGGIELERLEFGDVVAGCGEGGVLVVGRCGSCCGRVKGKWHCTGFCWGD